MQSRNYAIIAAFLAAMFTPTARAVAQEVGRDTVIETGPLDSLTVTVLRTPFALTRVPYAVAVNTREEIQRGKPGLGLDEALRGIPGVQVDNRFNYALGERISIRGFGARAQFGVRGVRVLVDGIPATLPDGQTTLSHLDLGLLSRVEVIRGPASALYGNAAGGVIQLETELPPPVPIAQEVGAIAGADGLLRIHSTTGGRSGNTSYLLNLARLEYGGFREFSAAENLHLNARLGWHGARDEVRLLLNAVDYDAQNPGSLSDSLLRADRSQAFRFNRVQRTGEEGRQGQAGLFWRRALPVGELEISGYALARRIDNPIPPAIIDLDRRAGGARALFRSSLVPEGGRLQWALGAELDAQRDQRENFANEGGTRGALLLDQREGVTGVGIFAQAAGELLPRLSLLGGLRYDRVGFRVDDELLDGDLDDSGERIMDAWSPSVGISYALAEPLHLYGNVATSFETPTTTELANRPGGAGGFNAGLEPQRTLSFELGSKGRWRSATYQLALYRARVTDALIPFEIADAPDRQFFRNAGSTIHRGIEAGLALPVARGITARAAYTFTDARFDEYTVDRTAFDGNRVPGIAPHRGEVILSYQQPEGALSADRGARAFADLEIRYSSEVPVNDANTGGTASPGYAIADLRAGVEGVRLGRFSVTPLVGVSNAFGVDYNTSVVVNAFGRRFYEPGPGRAIYAGVRVGIGER